MKEAMKGLGRAVLILFVFLVIMNVTKMLFVNSEPKGYDEVNIYDEEAEKDKKNKVDDKSEFDNNYNYEAIYKMYSYNLVQENFGSEFKNIYYKGEPFTNEFYLFLSIVNLTKNNFLVACENEVKVPEVNVNTKMQELFGGVNYTPISFTNKDKTLEIKYDEAKKEYIVKTKECSGVKPNNPYMSTKLLGGVSKDNYIEIVEEAHYITFEEKDGEKVETGHVGVDEGSSIVTDNSKVNYPKYRFKFVKDGISYHLLEINAE